MSKWEYYTPEVTLAHLESADWLNSLGKQGWELVCLTKFGEKQLKWLAIFKREIPDS